mmetsp:Transcript_58370/g.160239  ORF Transcript_58370/g.160239 Transcript_58370/m.160239 type:complete len:224 (+) Transcript_58370:171-842(+)
MIKRHSKRANTDRLSAAVQSWAAVADVVVERERALVGLDELITRHARPFLSAAVPTKRDPIDLQAKFEKRVTWFEDQVGFITERLNLRLMQIDDYGDELYLGEDHYPTKAHTDLQALLTAAAAAGETRQAAILSSVPPSVSKAIEHLDEKPPPRAVSPRLETGPAPGSGVSFRLSSPRSAVPRPPSAAPRGAGRGGPAGAPSPRAQVNHKGKQAAAGASRTGS